MKFSKGLFIFFILISTNLLCFMPYSALGIGKYMSFITIILMLLLFALGNKELIFADSNFKTEVILLLALPFISSISCYIYRGQDIITTIIATRSVLFWIIYFLLHQYRFSPCSITNVLICVASCVTIIYIVQQLAYPSLYLFDSPQEGKPPEIRNGLRRFRIFLCNPYVFFAFYTFLVYAFRKRLLKYWYYTLFFFIAIYLTLTRQIWVSILLPVLAYPFLQGNKLSIKMLLGLGISSLILYLIYLNIGNIIGGELIAQTKDQLDRDDDIRMIALNFYGLEYWEGIGNIFFGNGVPSWGNSQYGNFIQHMEEDYGLYRSDIGIVGIISQYGIIYFFAFIAYYVKVFKYFSKLSVSLKMLLLASLINLPLASWDMFPLYMGIITYLADCDIRNNNVNVLQYENSCYWR